MAEKEINSDDLSPWCMLEGKWIMVHGHNQCQNTGKNVTECCNGETAECVETYKGYKIKK